MARYLLIEVDSNATADRLRAQIDAADVTKGMRVVAMFRRPTQLCECLGYPTRGPGNEAYVVRGERFGWWICPQCRKPRKGSGQILWNMLDEEHHEGRVPTKHREVWISVRWFLDAAGKVRTALTPRGK